MSACPAMHPEHLVQCSLPETQPHDEHLAMARVGHSPLMVRWPNADYTPPPVAPKGRSGRVKRLTEVKDQITSAAAEVSLVAPQAHQVTGSEHPVTSRWAADAVVRDLTGKMHAVLWAHRELTACTEAEVVRHLEGSGVFIGHFDNARKRRGEMMNPERGFVSTPLMEEADPAVYGYGPNLTGTDQQSCTRYILTEAGRSVAASISIETLRSTFGRQEVLAQALSD